MRGEKYIVYHSSEIPPLGPDEEDIPRIPDDRGISTPREVGFKPYGKYSKLEILLSGIFHHIFKLFIK